ncbi:MAG: hypothetical protein AB7V62_08865 [Thermoleophilia bacterium]
MAAVALFAAACGDDDSGASTAPATELAVSEYNGEDLVEARTLDCAPADAVCENVIALLPTLEPDPNEACTLLYGGPQRYLVEGTVAGEPVSIEVTRANGCNIARFDQLREALGDPPLEG